MRGLRVLGTGVLGVLALVGVVAGPRAEPAEAQVFGGFGMTPGFSGCPSLGIPTGLGSWPSSGALLGSGACPGFGMPFGLGACPALGTFPGHGACPGLGTFPGLGTSPGFGAFPGLGAAAAAPAAAPTERVRLSMADNFFFPAEISVPVGTQVAWVNGGRNPHTTTFPGIWDSGSVPPGGRWAAIFAVAGTFDYLCTIHPNEMRGRLIVTLP